MSALATNKKRSSMRDGSRYDNPVKKSRKERILLNPQALVRQSSAKNDEGETIPNTATFIHQPHCLVSKIILFDELVNHIYGKQPFAKDFPRTRLKASLQEGVSVLEGAIWTKAYLERKIVFLSKNPTLKVGIGQCRLEHEHIYIIKSILGHIENIIAEEVEKVKEEAKEEAINEEEMSLVASASVSAAASSSGKRSGRHGSSKLIF
jgi:hypothetical protein